MLASTASTPSWCSHSFGGQGMYFACQTIGSIRDCSMVNCNKESTPWEAWKKHYEDTLKVSLKAFDNSIDMWEQTACKRGKCRASVLKGTDTCEANRTAAAEQCRRARKNSANWSPTAAIISCLHCQTSFRTWIGLTSHLPTHRDQPQLQDD